MDHQTEELVTSCSPSMTPWLEKLDFLFILSSQTASVMFVKFVLSGNTIFFLYSAYGFLDQQFEAVRMQVFQPCTLYC